MALAFAPDEGKAIVRLIRSQVSRGCDLILLSGGLSVDPDDMTRSAIRQAGAHEVYFGAAMLPGAMLLVVYLGEVLLLGVPACALHHRINVLDLVLPRLLAGEWWARPPWPVWGMAASAGIASNAAFLIVLLTKAPELGNKPPSKETLLWLKF